MNQLFYGDNLEVLQKHIGDESVDLCYVDPPFNSKRNYNQIYNNVGKDDIAQSQAFVDTWNWGHSAEWQLDMLHKEPKYSLRLVDTVLGLERILGKGAMLAYLVNMAVRFVEIWRVLKPTGSFYVHCDPTASHYLKIILDAVFCDKGGDFRNEIIWHYTGNSVPKYCLPRKHDVLFWYSKRDKPLFFPKNILVPYAERTNQRYNHVDAEGRRYKISALRDGKQEIVYMKEGKYPDDVWDIPIARGKERLGYNTQKPLILLERIIQA
jgi:site-specific DNA-methyltransferase (adenine-specific)